MWVKKKQYVTEEQLATLLARIDRRLDTVELNDTDLLKYYRETVRRHSEEINLLLKIVSEAGLIKEFNNETDNSVVEYLGTKWKIKKVK